MTTSIEREAVAAPTVEGRRGARVRMWWRAACDRPVLTCAVVGLGARLAFAVASFVLNGAYLVGDELQYVQLATTVADGQSAEAWFRFYGQSLYDSTWAFLAPITFLFKVFGPSRLVAQLWSVAFGVLVVALVTVLALRVADRRWAIGAGLVAALLPSQVLWSSIVLRESMVWAGLALAAYALYRWSDGSDRTLVESVLLLLLALVMLARLREQTFVVAAWALVPAVALAGGRRWLARAGVALALTVFLPWALGVGPAGYHLVQQAIPSLATTRTNLALHADSGFTPTTVLGPRPAAAGGAPGQPPVTAPPGQTALPADDGNIYAVDETVSGSVRALPRGLVAVLLRPFPWERASSVGVLMAKFESLAWWSLYALAAIGVLVTGRRNRRVLAYPVLVVLLISGVGAVTQGNLGTAFRHRGQLAWALVVCAAAGAQAMADRRSRAVRA